MSPIVPDRGVTALTPILKGASVDVVETVVTAASPLLGVALGAWMTDLQHRRSARRDQDGQLRAARRTAYAKFIGAARTWQSNVLEPEVVVATSHRGAQYADAGIAYGETIRGLTELRLVAGDEATIQAAIAWEQALRELSWSRASDSDPEPAPVAVKAAESDFIDAARQELAAPAP